jgi:hypothetical protein
MALVDNAWYVNYGNGSNTGYYAVATWSNHTAVAGEIIRQLTAPAVGSERCFVCTTAGATGSSEPTWVNTRGALNTSSSAVYQECTGVAALNGDATNTPTWTTVKNTAVTLGQVIKRNNAASYQICTVAGTAGNGSEPSFSDTAGTVTNDGATLRWTSLGVVGNFTGGQAPHARIANAMTTNWAQAGNSVHVHSAHRETQATAITHTGAGTVASPICVYCHDGTHYPPQGTTTGATVTMSGNVLLSISSTGLYLEGISYNLTGASNTGMNFATQSGSRIKCKNCQFNQTGTVSTSIFAIGAQIGATNPCAVEWDNVTLTFGSTGHCLALTNCNFVYKNTASAVSGSAPANFFGVFATSDGDNALVQGVDLSALGSGKNLVSEASAGAGGLYRFIDCKLGASVALTGTQSSPAIRAEIINSDSGATNYRLEAADYAGSQSIETTIVRTGGANNGATNTSWKIVTTANASWLWPYRSIPIAAWNDVADGSSVTLTVYGIWGGGAVPNNDDIFIEVEYLGSASTPLGSFTNSTKSNNLASATPLSSDNSNWGGSTTAFSMSVTFVPRMAGPINLVVNAAKATTTFYIDPVPTGLTTKGTRAHVVPPGVLVQDRLGNAARAGLHPIDGGLAA